MLGKGSGLDNVALWLDRMGVGATDEQLQVILQEVKAKSLEKKQLLRPEEFVAIVDKTIGPVPVAHRS